MDGFSLEAGLLLNALFATLQKFAKSRDLCLPLNNKSCPLEGL